MFGRTKLIRVRVREGIVAVRPNGTVHSLGLRHKILVKSIRAFIRGKIEYNFLSDTMHQVNEYL